MIRATVALAALLALTACRPDPHAPAGRIGDGLSTTTQPAPPVPAPHAP